MPIKVLYVEDELFLGKIVKETLETRGFEVIMESDGADVIRSFEDENRQQGQTRFQIKIQRKAPG